MKRPARLFWIAIGILCTVLLAVAVYAVVVFNRGKSREARAVAVVVEGKEPLHAREIVFDGPDCSEEEHAAFAQLAEVVQSAPDADYVLDLAGEEIEAVRTWEPARASLPLLEKYLALEPSSHEVLDELHRIWRRVGDPLRTAPLSERDRLAVDIARALNEPHWPAARDVCLDSPETGEREIRAMAPGDLMPDISMAGWFSILKVPLRTAPAFALEGNGDEAVRRWMTGFHGTQRIRGLPYVIGFVAWNLANGRLLDTLWTMLPSLPPSVELKEVEEALRTIDAADHVTRALVGERALGNDLFDSWRGTLQGTPSDKRGLVTRFVTIPWVAHDHAFYMETMTDGIRRAALPYRESLAQRSDWQRDINLFPRTAIISTMILPKIDDVIENRARLEARLRVAIIALIARREGAEAGLRAAASQLDPFDGRPLRARVGTDGLFTVWSIGSNLVDDGAPVTDDADVWEALDVAWRVRVP